MNALFSPEVWQYGDSFLAFENPTAPGVELRGFLERDSMKCAPRERSRAGLVSTERYMLIAEPAEDFSGAVGTKICRGESEFELVNANGVYVGELLSHWECVLRRVQ